MKKADYGLDAPGLVKCFLFGGLFLIVVSAAPLVLSIPEDIRDFMSGMVWPGVSFTLSGCLMIWSSYSGKFRARDKLINSLALKGTETLLDLGCGRGLLLLGAAKQLKNGKAIGVDLWSQQDLSSNSRDAVISNASIEGVKDRVEIVDGDMRKLPLPDQSVDCVVASMSIHNIPNAEGRKQAVQQAARVLKAGGRVALLDFRNTSEYEATLRELGFSNVNRGPISFWNFPPSRTVSGQKPTLNGGV